MFFDPLYLLFMIPGVLLMLWAQSKVKGAYRTYGDPRNPANRTAFTGAQAARRILDANGLTNVPVEPTPGELTDHYDPRQRILRLSQGVYEQPTVAAVGVAAHEAGHAIQHAKAYAPLMARTAIVPAVNIGSNLGIFVVILGLILANTTMAWIGVLLFALSTVFALITLPVEFDASRRAKEQLVRLGLIDGGVAGGSESVGVARVLDAAAWTYVAGFAASLLTLLYYVTLVGRSSND